MLRLILFLALLAAVAVGLSWLADRPGEISITWQGYQIETSVLVGIAAVLATCIFGARHTCHQQTFAPVGVSGFGMLEPIIKYVCRGLVHTQQR